jgi:uncharacterized repeat protein (TIGR03837 family)
LNQTTPRWDIFCAVIDNYGDIGVCWRLARQLVAEHGFAVRLWVDDVSRMQPLHPEIDASLESQIACGVEVRRWVPDFPEVEPADVVIEAFGCVLPMTYEHAMTRCARPPVWINLEYLSAESWVEMCHALPSPHPVLNLTKYFFFPGFTEGTGHLLRESGLLEQRETFRASSGNFRDVLGIPPPNPDELLISLFCYDTAPVDALLTQWEQSEIPVRCLLPIGHRSSFHLQREGEQPIHLQPGSIHQHGNLTLHALPFLRQEDYDKLLWLCDLNFVRGEDSFVRAMWAGKPLVWQIYPQEDDAHRPKLDAFLDLYTLTIPEPALTAMRAFHLGWNNFNALSWKDFIRHRKAFESNAAGWADYYYAQSDLASKLVIFCGNKV